MFRCNVGMIDRGVRAVLGLLLLSLVFIGPQSLWGLVGLIPLGTAAVGFCPMYRPFGLSSCKTA